MLIPTYSIDVLVSNDTYPAIHGPMEDADIEDLRKTIEGVVVFPFALMQAAIPQFKAQSRGNIILITCRAGMKGSFHVGTIIKFAGGWPAAPQRPV